MATIEIEDDKGNTLGSFIIKNITEKDIKKLDNFDLADVEDDYINNEKEVIRLQLIEEEFK